VSIHYTAEDIAAMPATDAIQQHDAGEEADTALQDGLLRLAECSSCGQPLPEVTA
jgi:hypothetical protein